MQFLSYLWSCHKILVLILLKFQHPPPLNTLDRVHSVQVFHISFDWSLSDTKFPQVSQTFLSILAGFNSAVVWLPTHPTPLHPTLISSFLSLFSRPLRTIPKTPTSIGISVTFMFHIFFFYSSLARSKYLYIILLSFIFTFTL